MKLVEDFLDASRFVQIRRDIHAHPELGFDEHRTSEIGARQERIYLPVPGRYDGHYPYPGKVFSS